jgi:hypothetical protein
VHTFWHAPMLDPGGFTQSVPGSHGEHPGSSDVESHGSPMPSYTEQRGSRPSGVSVHPTGLQYRSFSQLADGEIGRRAGSHTASTPRSRTKNWLGSHRFSPSPATMHSVPVAHDPKALHGSVLQIAPGATGVWHSSMHAGTWPAGQSSEGAVHAVSPGIGAGGG